MVWIILVVCFSLAVLLSGYVLTIDYRSEKIKESKSAVFIRIHTAKGATGPSLQDFQDVFRNLHDPKLYNLSLVPWRTTDVLKYSPQLKAALENLESKVEPS